MRREDFSLEVSNVETREPDDPGLPTLAIDFEGEASTLETPLRDREGELLEADRIDASVRLQDSPGSTGSTGVVGIADRITGEFVLECNVDAGTILSFVRAARRRGENEDGDAEYRIRLLVDGDPLVEYEKRTFLVYSDEGELLRQHSLIPSGVEI